MKKTVLTYGFISGVIGAVLLLAHVPYMDGGSKALIFGYTGIVLSSLLIFFGVRSYRETVGDGRISFGRAAGVGVLIALISSACYVATWEVVYFTHPEIAEHVFDKPIEELKAKGAPQADIDAAVVQLESFKKLYANPLANAAFTFIEPFPVGLLMTLISALVLRRK